MTYAEFITFGADFFEFVAPIAALLALFSLPVALVCARFAETGLRTRKSEGESFEG